jgi:hypothetical protein
MKLVRIRIPFVAAALLITGVIVAVGQSGRRTPARQGTPPVAEPSPSPAPSPVKTTIPQYSLKVMIDIPLDSYTTFPFPERMQDWAVGRLQKSSLLKVTVAEPGNRSQATKQAKAETETLIVWLGLDENPFAGSDQTGHRRVSSQVSINLSILAPGSGKPKYSSRIFLGQHARGIGGTEVDRRCYPGVRGDDYLLLQASLEAAARVMNHLNVPVTSGCIREGRAFVTNWEKRRFD